MFISIPDNARQCKLISLIIIITQLSIDIHIWLCVGVCVNKAGDVTGVHCSLLQFTPNLTDGSTCFVQVDLVVA